MYLLMAVFLRWLIDVAVRHAILLSFFSWCPVHSALLVPFLTASPPPWPFNTRTIVTKSCAPESPRSKVIRSMSPRTPHWGQQSSIPATMLPMAMVMHLAPVAFSSMAVMFPFHLLFLGFGAIVFLGIIVRVYTCNGWRNEDDIIIYCIWAAPSEFGTYRLCEQRRVRRACASAQSRQNLRCSLIQAESQEEPSDRKPDLWPLWMAGHAQLKFVITECSKTQIRLTRHIYFTCLKVWYSWECLLLQTAAKYMYMYMFSFSAKKVTKYSIEEPLVAIIYRFLISWSGYSLKWIQHVLLKLGHPLNDT